MSIPWPTSEFVTSPATIEDWAWGLSLIMLTIAIHATGIAFMARVLQNILDRMRREGHWPRHVLTISISLISATGLLLTVLHGIEAGVWAAAYWGLGAIRTPEEAMLYSLNSITTQGNAGLVLKEHWRMMGALEAVNGMLLFGISTAFLFAVMQAYSPLIMTMRHRH